MTAGRAALRPPSPSHSPAARGSAPVRPLASALGGRGASNQETRPR